MARKVVTTVYCDACAKKGLEVKATEVLSIMADEYDMCLEHAEKFRDQLRAALAPSGDVALTA
ncbi:hypothetical protein ACFQ71_02940 [Streptomyces sp. NPDC056534]|uniref:hypothetical protein n=1 Tax=Streptomyces sp. NPDC056534 TaxID=3345857 RepID=UPI0036B00C28